MKYSCNEIKAAGSCIRFAEECLGAEVKHGRCAAVWRGGDGPNVSIEEEKWHDFVEEKGGSIIDLCAVAMFDGSVEKAVDYLGEWLNLKPLPAKRKSPSDKKPSRYAERIEEGFQRVKRYEYRDLNGVLVHFKDRWEHPDGKKGKEFSQGVIENGKERPWLGDTQTILYRLKDWVSRPRVCIVEGEKDADTLNDLGIPATTNCEGASKGSSSKWKPEYNPMFDGKHVVILRDNDEAGEEHANFVASKLQGHAASITILCPSALPKGDVTDWIQKEGGTREKLVEMIKAAEPIDPDAIKAVEPKQDPVMQRFGPIWSKEIWGKNSKNETLLVDAIPAQPYWAGLYFTENRILYEPDEREFYRYSEETGLWVPETDAQIQQGISDRLLDESRKNQGHQFVAKHRSQQTLISIERQLRGIAEQRGTFASRRGLVACSNGVYDVMTGTFAGFDPSHRLRAGLSVCYDPSAICQRFVNDLLVPALPSDDIRLLQRFAGLCVLGENLAQRFLIMDGNAGTGKSTIVQIIRAIVGEHNCAELRTENLDSRFELYRIRRASLLIGADVSGDFLEKDGARRIKALTGGDPLEAEAKGSNSSFTLDGHFNIVISCNERLRMRIESDAGAWKRRLAIIRFEGRPPERRIPNLAQTLIQTEGPGILNWMLEGAKALLDELHESGDMTLSGRQQRRVENLLSESQSLSVFLDRHVCRDHGIGASSDLSVEELVEGYYDFCAEQSWTPHPLRTIQAKLPQHMLEKFGTSKANSIKRQGRNVKGFSRVMFLEASQTSLDFNCKNLGTSGTYS